MLLARLVAYRSRFLFSTSVSTVPLRSLLSLCFFSGLAKLSSLSLRSRRLLLSTGRNTRCLRGERVSLGVADFVAENEFSRSCDKLASRNARLDAFGTRVELSPSSNEAYLNVALRGLDRVALASAGDIKMVGSLGLGLRRRAMSAAYKGPILIEISKTMWARLAQECCCMDGWPLEYLSAMFVIARCPGD
jgi:hypothetical protein